MLQRTKKQIVYAAGATAILFALVAIIITSTTQPEGESTVATPNFTYQDIKLEAIDIIRHQPRAGFENTIDIVARLRNPNAGAGISTFNLSFLVNDAAGREVKRVEVETYILPGAIQYAMALNVPVGVSEVASVEVKLPQNPVFIPLQANATPPSFSAFARERKNSSPAGVAIQEQIGIVKNTSTFAWEKVEVYVVGQDSEGKLIAAGKTFLGALTVGEEREFTVTWPLPEGTIERVIILPATNMFQEANIIRAIGNPGILQ